MKYTSTVTHQFTQDPAVSFTVRHLTEGRRIKIQLGLADKYDRQDAIRSSVAPAAARLKPLIQKSRTDGTAIEGVDLADVNRATRQINAIEYDEILPVFVKALLVSVDGLEIDGTPATPETMIESGPPELYAEIAKAVRHEMGLDDQETGNSEPPSTSPAPADGATPSTSADSASGAVTT